MPGVTIVAGAAAALETARTRAPRGLHDRRLRRAADARRRGDALSRLPDRAVRRRPLHDRARGLRLRRAPGELARELPRSLARCSRCPSSGSDARRRHSPAATASSLRSRGIATAAAAVVVTDRHGRLPLYRRAGARRSSRATSRSSRGKGTPRRSARTASPSSWRSVIRWATAHCSRASRASTPRASFAARGRRRRARTRRTTSPSRTTARPRTETASDVAVAARAGVPRTGTAADEPCSSR
jgi:hypothetical protein